MVTATEPATTQAPSAFAWVLIAGGIILFPVVWVAVILGRALDLRPFTKFLARSDAHVFFDLPGVLGDLRAFPILFTLLPATGVTLVAGGVSLRRGDRWPRAILVAAVAGLATLVVAWLVVAFVVAP